MAPMMAGIAMMQQYMMQAVNPQAALQPRQPTTPTRKSSRHSPTVTPSSSPHSRRRSSITPSKRSAGPSFLSDRVPFPTISTWLNSLDSDPDRGQYGVNYAQYATSLEENGIIHVGDLANESVEQLQKLGGMKYGTAKRLHSYVAKDVEQFLRAELKKQRAEV